ncbi:hypothetical protein [Bradyrhizobium sp. SZCCHNRI20481]|uniref:hypothetical protein n=1 Tax=Bradyrhizobium sp. SZCCHNRI20481 TaxID=3057286 RepID=UPI002916AEFF|nr:hypothetical protein [Bradyrhizobium sp. SZCCHNRI20481]
MAENVYQRWMREDNDRCLPVVDGKHLEGLMYGSMAYVIEKLGEGPKPTFALDLEHLQVADYGAFEGVSDLQRQFILKLHEADPIRPEEMLFLGLQSLFIVSWPKPESVADIEFAAAYNFVLNKYLAETALNLADKFRAPSALLPYWGRLSFLRVMAELPEEHVTRYKLDKVACALVKRAKFNATTFALDDGALIGANYALEPILKHLNKYLLHYFSTKEMAGPKRLSRAWEGIVPTVLHFWSDVDATRITRSTTTLYDERMGAMAHRLTVDQLDFIMMHELGHVALDHPRRLKAEKDSGFNIKTVRHEFEYAADAFALGLMRSKLVANTRIATEAPDRADDARVKRVTDGLRDYQSSLGGVYLLFVYMDFIQQAGELLQTRLKGKLRLRDAMDSHPRASDRLDRLELTNLGEYLYTSPLERYSRQLMQTVLDYGATLDDEALLQSAIGTLS